MPERKQQDAPEDQAAVATGDTANEPYVGVDPIYQNHASDTEKPMVSEGDEGRLEELARKREQAAREVAEAGSQAVHPRETAKEQEEEEEEEEEELKPKRAASRRQQTAKTE